MRDSLVAVASISTSLLGADSMATSYAVLCRPVSVPSAPACARRPAADVAAWLSGSFKLDILLHWQPGESFLKVEQRSMLRSIKGDVGLSCVNPEGR